MKNQKGFTLIELVVVIIILGILAAYAIPKYIALDTGARVSVVKGLQGTIKSTIAMVHTVAKVDGIANGIVYLDNTENIVVANYYPTAAFTGIVDAIESYTSDYSVYGFSVNVTNNSIATFQLNGAPDGTNCAVSYDITNLPPVVNITTNGC